MLTGGRKTLAFFLFLLYPVRTNIFKESTMTIRFIGGLWRRIDGKNIKSFSTYQEAVDNKGSWEDQSPQTPSDDIADQIKD